MNSYNQINNQLEESLYHDTYTKYIQISVYSGEMGAKT